MSDNIRQLAWLNYQAKFRGFGGLEDLPSGLFEVLARMWRLTHPC